MEKETMTGKTVYYYNAKCEVAEQETDTGRYYLKVLDPSEACPYKKGEVFSVSEHFVRAYLDGARHNEIMA